MYVPSGSRATWSRPSTDASCTIAAPRRWKSGATAGPPPTSMAPSTGPTTQPATAPCALRNSSKISRSESGGGPRRRKRPGRKRIVHPYSAASAPAAANSAAAEPRQIATTTAAAPRTCRASATHPRIPGPPGLRMIDATRGGRGAETVVDVDHGHARRAGIEHSEEGGEPSERRAVPDARRYGDHGDLHEAAHDAGQRTLHSRHDDDHRGGTQYVGLREEPVDARDPHVRQALDAVLQSAGSHGRFFSDGEVARPGGADQHRAPSRGCGLRVGRQVRRPAQLVALGAREACPQSGRVGSLDARRQKTAARHLQPLGDGHHLPRRLPLTKDHLLMALCDGPEVIDRREGELLEVHAAAKAAVSAK